ncbi:MAG: hypothetical protein ACLQVN_13530 [Bryobacteraceae bacterium]
MCPSDTTAEAWQVFLELQRRMPPAEKLRRALELSAGLRRAAEAGLRERYPNAGDREIFLRLARLVLGEELFEKAYGKAALPDERAR